MFFIKLYQRLASLESKVRSQDNHTGTWLDLQDSRSRKIELELKELNKKLQGLEKYLEIEYATIPSKSEYRPLVQVKE